LVLLGDEEVLSQQLSQLSVDDPDPQLSFLDLLTIPELPPPRMRYDRGQEIASRSCITTDEYLTFLREQRLAKEAKIEAARKKKEDSTHKKKKRLEELALKRIEITKKKEEQRKRHKEMKLQREMAKQQREVAKQHRAVERETARAGKAMLKGSNVVSKSTKPSSSHDSLHSDYRLAIKLVVEQGLPPPLPPTDI
jgi:outer membrane biosynthesis protein TonB